MTKNKRHSKICELINEFEISTQEELTEKLNEKGFNVSQATVSRDIKELGLIKGQGVAKKIKYVKYNFDSQEISEKIINLFKQIVLSVDFANNLIVIKTMSGNGGSAGVAIDQMHFPEVLGTVAGDDTLLIVTKTNTDAETIVKTLRTL